MYADNPRSRITREFFYILNAMKDHYKALLRLGEDDPVRIGPILVLLAVYMLREEGKKHIRPLDIVHETQLPRSSIYRILNDMADEQILQNNLGEFMCLSRTPEFLLNPTELYGRPLATVKDKDYRTDEATQEAMQEMVQRAVSEEFAKLHKPSPVLAPAGIGIGGIEDMRKEAEEIMPMSPIVMRTTTPPILTPQPPKKKKKVEKLENIDMDMENTVEEELDDFFI